MCLFDEMMEEQSRLKERIEKLKEEVEKLKEIHYCPICGRKLGG